MKPIILRKITARALPPYNGVDEVSAFDWYEGVVPVEHLLTADLWGVGYGVPRGRMTLKKWERWADEQSESEEDDGVGYDFDALQFPVTDPIVVTYEGGSHLHIWDGWHRSALAVFNKKAQPEVPAYIGILKPGFERESAGGWVSPTHYVVTPRRGRR